MEDNQIQLTTTVGYRGWRTLQKRKHYDRWRNRSREAKIFICTLFALAGGICPGCDQAMFISFDGKYCEHPKLATLDHITPLSKILEHRKYGLQIMCFECNKKKGDKLQTINQKEEI